MIKNIDITVITLPIVKDNDLGISSRYLKNFEVLEMIRVFELTKTFEDSFGQITRIISEENV